MSQNGAHFKIQDVELYDYILYEPGEYKDRNYSWHNLLTQFCVTGSQLQCMYVDRDPQEYQNELFMQFMTFVKSFNPLIAIQIMKVYSSTIRQMMMRDEFDLKYVETLLTWDQTLLETLFYNYEKHPLFFCLPITSSKSGYQLRKLKMVGWLIRFQQR